MEVHLTLINPGLKPEWNKITIISEEVEFLPGEAVYVFSEDSEIASLVKIKHGVLNMGDAVTYCIGATQMESLIFAENNIQVEIAQLDEKRALFSGLLESVRSEMRDQELPY